MIKIKINKIRIQKFKLLKKKNLHSQVTVTMIQNLSKKYKILKKDHQKVVLLRKKILLNRIKFKKFN